MKKELTKAEVAEKLLELRGTNPQYLKPEDFKWLSQDQIGGLSKYQIGWLSQDQIGGLSQDQIGWLSKYQIGWLSKYQIGGLSKDQIGWLSQDQIGGLSQDQIGGLSQDQIGWLSSEQKKVVDTILHDVPTLDKPYSSILKSILADGCKLDMGAWHRCETTHCLAGWTVHLAGEKGYALEKVMFGDGTPDAAALILRKSRPDAPLPNFYATDSEALAFIKARAKEEAA